ncbi:MAG: cryptochrome/photolyase family protein [Bacteroidota bacterium]
MIIPSLTHLAHSKPTKLFWFRRDLRIEDNHGLYQALATHHSVLPLFIFDANILEKLEKPIDDRVQFIYAQVQSLKAKLEQLGSSLLVCYGTPVAVYQQLTRQLPLKAVYTNHDYEPYARHRDREVAACLAEHQVAFHSFKDQVIFEKDEVVKDNGSPYTVFTPYMRKWKTHFKPEMVNTFNSEALLPHCLKTSPLPLLALPDIGFQVQRCHFPSKTVDIALVKQYDQQRDIPAILGTSRLSVHLRFGTISIRAVTRVAQQYNAVWLNELIWRNFYMMILWHFPHVVKGSFKPSYDKVAWENNQTHFQAWCAGQTGYPIVDAGMRELNETGYMHNRLRMITASFLTKHLLIDWRWGEAYFAKKLLDFELSSNNGGWQWAAGSGCDAAPYFRIFNPYLQTKKFDPAHKYIKQWVPELNSTAYPKPIVVHSIARERTLSAYKEALAGGGA